MMKVAQAFCFAVIFFTFIVFAQDNSRSAGSSNIAHISDADYFTRFSQYYYVHYSQATGNLQPDPIEDDDRFLDDDVYFESSSDASQLKWLW